MPFTDVFKTKILHGIFDNTPIDLGTIYVGLFSIVPNPPTDNTGVEVIDTVYTRLPATFTVVDQTASCGQLMFAPAASDIGFITGFGLFTAATGGELSYYGMWSDVYNISVGDQFIVNSISIHFDQAL
jgi:hypothetical protein